MIPQPDARGWFSLSGAIPTDEVSALAALGPIAQLSVTHTPELGVRLAKRLADLRVDRLWLWCLVTRRAMQHVIRMPELRVLDVFEFGAGKLPSLRPARSLEVLRMNLGMSEHDLLQIAQCERLIELGAQGAGLTRCALDALLALPRLAALDLESTCFDDAMARRVARASTLASLDIGATRITGAGLRHLVSMPSLRALDLWSTPLGIEDLQLLREMPHLEQLSVGRIAAAQVPLDPEALVALILELPRLRKLWLDGVQIDESQQRLLESRLESLRVTD